MKFIHMAAIMTHLANFRFRIYEAIGYSIGWFVSKLNLSIRSYAEHYLLADKNKRADESLGKTRFVSSAWTPLYGEPKKPRGMVNVSLRVRHKDEVLLDRETLRELATKAVDRITEKSIIAA